MTTCPFGPSHPEFVVTKYPGGIAELGVCWDSTDIRRISAELRELADTLDELPEGSEATGIMPL